MSLKVEKTHPHGKKCENFRDALKWGMIIVVEGEPQIKGKPPKGATAGNVLTGETYNPQDFAMNMVIEYCPFCGKKIYNYPKDEEDD